MFDGSERNSLIWRRQTIPVPNFQQKAPICWGHVQGADCMNRISAVPHTNAAASNCTDSEVVAPIFPKNVGDLDSSDVPNAVPEPFVHVHVIIGRLSSRQHHAKSSFKARERSFQGFQEFSSYFRQDQVMLSDKYYGSMCPSFVKLFY